VPFSEGQIIQQTELNELASVVRLQRVDFDRLRSVALIPELVWRETDAFTPDDWEAVRDALENPAGPIAGLPRCIRDCTRWSERRTPVRIDESVSRAAALAGRF